MSYLDSELYVTSLHQARFSWDGHDYASGKLTLGSGLHHRLLELETQPETYGNLLFDAVFPKRSALREGFREALARATGDRRRLRLRLHLAADLPADVHGLCWELLRDSDRKVAISRSPDTAFSRYSTVPWDPGRATLERPRLLAAVAAPSNAERYRMVALDPQRCRERLAASLAALEGQVSFDVLGPPATPGRLRERLREGGYHVLHVFGHGMVRPQRSSCLVLENDDGTACFVEESVLAEIFLGNRDLRLVTLIACNGGALSSNDAFSGLAGRLVERGLPAVLGMSRPVRIDAAELFTDHVYRNLACDGHVDAAVNEARQQLFLKEPNQVGWSSPVLFMRLGDGRLWDTEEANDRSLGEGTAGTPVPVTVVPERRPWSWVRQAVLALVTIVLGLALWPASRVEADFDLIVSDVSFRLAERQPVVGRFRLSELAASFLDEIRLPRSLGRPDPIRASDLPRPLGMILRAGDPPSEITLQQTIVPADMVVSIEHLEAMSYRLSLERRSPLAEEAAPRAVELSVGADGPARFKMLHEKEWMAVAGESLETLRFKPFHDKAEIDVTFRRLAGDEFSQPLTVSGLRLFEVEEKTDAGGTVVVEVSTIRAGSAVLTSSGIRHRLKEKEELRFARPRGELYRLEPCQDGIALGFRGTVSDLEARIPGGVEVRPTVLGLWLGKDPGRALLAVLVVLAGALGATTIRAGLRLYLGRRRHGIVVSS